MKFLREIIECDFDINILGVAEDSRLVKPGFLFVATKGFNVDHFDYIDAAIENGAVAVVCDREIALSVPTIIVSDVFSAYISCCENFYGVKNEDFNFIGITGTDGKTTVATLIKEILEPSIKTAYIGTNGMEVCGKHFPTSNTTPCISELYSLFSNIKSLGCKDVSMEVSSEALLHNRVNGLKYDIAVYTNITEDHLNVHKSIENYVNCKLELCKLVKDNGVIFVNGDDEGCKAVTDKRKVTFGFNDDNDCVIYDVKQESSCVKFKLKYLNNIYDLESPLVGIFNIYNIALVFLVGLRKGISAVSLIDRIKKFKSVAGRMEDLNFGQDYKIILDYAHTYNSIKNVLECFCGQKKGKIILVTGAAGGREKEKRSKIGTLILEKSDLVIFTMDDPRYEKVEDIIDQMIGDNKRDNYKIIVDRKDAIFTAFDLANKDDVVLVLGKGRDNYMAIEDKKLPYCDYDVIKSYFE